MHLSYFLSLLYGNVTRHLKNERAKNEAIAEGVQSLFERKYCWQLQQVPGPEALSDLCKRIASKSV